MMPHEHYQAAETLIDTIANFGRDYTHDDLDLMAKTAQVHATLANVGTKEIARADESP